MGIMWVQKMKIEWFKMRMSERRLNKLRLYAAMKDTTMTHVIEPTFRTPNCHRGKLRREKI
ncbi:hypothetical protein SAMD00079811_78570 (plasmid) [Scytonema sp. HK-05]